MKPFQLATHHSLDSSKELSALLMEHANAQREVQAWLAVLIPLHHAKGKTAMVQHIAESMNVSQVTVNRNLGKWRRHGWRGLINRAKYPEPGQRESLPDPFVEYWKGLLESYQRQDSGKAAWRCLKRQLATWRLHGTHPIPGYDSPPPNAPGQNEPKGWTYSNLMEYQPSKAQLMARRIGPQAASAWLPHNRTTRAGLLPLQEIAFDDQWYDVFVTHPENPRPMRPVGFNALDTLTGLFLAHESRLQTYDRETETRKQLTQEDFLWTVCGTLQRYGFRTDGVGTKLIFEHGTATGYEKGGLFDSESFDRALLRATDGAVTVARSGKFGAPLYSGMMFRGPGSGNFRFKSRLECMFRLVRTEMAGLPGPTGINPDSMPEETPALLKYHASLMELARKLPAHLASLMASELLTHQEWAELKSRLYHIINHRSDHTLEGWAESGFVGQEWRLDGRHWYPKSNLDVLDSRHRGELITADSFRFRPVKMSPMQAWECTGALDPKIKRLGASLIPALIPPHLSYAFKVGKKSMFSIKPRFAPTAHFIARIKTPSGGWDHLPVGFQGYVYYNPFAPMRCAVVDQERRYLGQVDLFVVPTASDFGAIRRNLGAIGQFRAEEMAEPIRRAAPLGQNRLEMREINDQVSRGIEPGTESMESLDDENPEFSEAEILAALGNTEPATDDPNGPESIYKF